jgi:PAS domain S-box-containing protein
MRAQAISPTGRAQFFEINETFFSTTDAKGVITAGNRIFSRTSGFTEDELVGQPHNLIRHPHMPRLVFRLLWQACKNGQPFMGYVKNQAKNGNHYWVFAVIVPIAKGYLSVRFKPTSPLLTEVESIYGKMLAAEEAAVTSGVAEGTAAEASAPVAATQMNSAGFDSYASFSHHALNTEIKNRDAEIERRGLQLFPQQLTGASETNTKLANFYGASIAIYRSINALFALLDSFIALRDGTLARKTAVQTIAEAVRLDAFNASIAAQSLGESGLALSTVSRNLSETGQRLSRNVAALTGNIARMVTVVTDVASNLSAARLQMEMLLSFGAEISSGETREDRALGMIRDLRTAFSGTLQQAFDAIRELRGHLPRLQASNSDLHKDIVYLRVIQTTGFTEAARLHQSGSLTATFEALRTQIESGKRELDQLDRIADELTALTEELPGRMVEIQNGVASTEDLDSATLLGTNDTNVGDRITTSRQTSSPPRGASPLNGEPQALSRLERPQHRP